MREVGIKVGQLDHGKTTSSNGRSVLYKKQVTERRTGMDGGQVLNHGCTNGLQGYSLDDDDALKIVLNISLKPRRQMTSTCFLMETRQRTATTKMLIIALRCSYWCFRHVSIKLVLCLFWFFVAR